MPEGGQTENIDKIEEESKEEQKDEEIKEGKGLEEDKSEFEGMEAVINGLQEEKEELKDKYLRALANYENLRKRAIQEREKIYSFTLEEVFRKILPILDDFKRAFKSLEGSEHHKDDYNSFYEGVRLINSNLDNLLKSYSIEQFDSIGEKFDPSKHEAIHVIEQNDKEENTIIEETETGYKIKDKILRPAKVIVTKKCEGAQEENQGESINQGGEEE